MMRNAISARDFHYIQLWKERNALLKPVEAKHPGLPLERGGLVLAA
jgi:hypothetical protein